MTGKGSGKSQGKQTAKIYTLVHIRRLKGNQLTLFTLLKSQKLLRIRSR